LGAASGGASRLSSGVLHELFLTILAKVVSEAILQQL
jgi:hypothetical protein